MRVIIGVKNIATIWAIAVPLTNLNTSHPNDFFEFSSDEL
jgi:hypothetical protein